MRAKIENNTHLEKDLQSKAVLNVDKKSLMGYKLQREKFKKTFGLQEEVSQLKEDMAEIKNMLSQLINNKTKD